MEHFQLPIVSKLADAILKYDMYDRLLVSNVFLTSYLWWEKNLFSFWIKNNNEYKKKPHRACIYILHPMYNGKKISLDIDKKEMISRACN